MNPTIRSASVAAVFLILLSVSGVAAHAELVSSDPADGATIETPYTITATFSEEFAADTEISFIRVQDAAGDTVASGGQSPDDPTVMTVDVPELDPGDYTVRWQTTTEDDNGTERGDFTFTVAAAATPPPRATPRASAPPVATVAPGPTATPGGSSGSPTGNNNDVLLALAIGVIIVGVLAFFLVRRSRT
jgi:methionine-rich copper-binding protein CopC